MLCLDGEGVHEVEVVLVDDVGEALEVVEDHGVVDEVVDFEFEAEEELLEHHAEGEVVGVDHEGLLAGGAEQLVDLGLEIGGSTALPIRG